MSRNGSTNADSLAVERRALAGWARYRIIAGYHDGFPDVAYCKVADWSIRIQFDTRCRVMKLIPYLGAERPGEVFERRGKSWVLIGIIKPEDKASGNVTPLTP